MQIKKSTLRNTGIGVIIVGVLIIFSLIKLPASGAGKNDTVTVDGDTQVINITAKAGYTPRKINAKADKSTVLRVSTSNTFDCSASIRIPSLNISEVLPVTGNTDIVLGPQRSGTKLRGTCGMGMYQFEVDFS